MVVYYSSIVQSLSRWSHSGIVLVVHGIESVFVLVSPTCAISFHVASASNAQWLTNISSRNMFYEYSHKGFWVCLVVCVCKTPAHNLNWWYILGVCPEEIPRSFSTSLKTYLSTVNQATANILKHLPTSLLWRQRSVLWWLQLWGDPAHLLGWGTEPPTCVLIR